MVSSMLPALPADMEVNKSLHKHTDYNVIFLKKLLTNNIEKSTAWKCAIKTASWKYSPDFQALHAFCPQGMLLIIQGINIKCCQQDFL